MSINVLSVALFACALQGICLAICLWTVPRNRNANRALAGLLGALVLYLTPYIIGYAGAYDRWPWLSFAPFNVTLAFGPLFYWHLSSLTGDKPAGSRIIHLAPVAVQFLLQALVFPLPLDLKERWHDAVHAPLIVPLFTAATVLSLIVYGSLAWRQYQSYRTWLRDNRADGPSMEPTWIRNTILATLAAAVVWCGFALARIVDPERDYFDDFWLYLGIGLLAVYLGIEGWRRAALAFPVMPPPQPLQVAAQPEPDMPDWALRAQAWAAEIDRLELWRDPEVSLASMARALGINTTYLSRALNEGLGVTFHAFVNGRRVEAVKRLLEDPSETRDLTTLAFDAGFNSKASFNRVFAQHTGVTPSAFRRMSRLKA